MCVVVVVVVITRYRSIGKNEVMGKYRAGRQVGISQPSQSLSQDSAICISVYLADIQKTQVHTIQ